MIEIDYFDVDEYYKEIIEYASYTCDAFCLTFGRNLAENESHIEEQNVRIVEREMYNALKPYLIKEIVDVHEWLWSKTNGNGFVFCVFKSCKETKDILLSIGKLSNWYDWKEYGRHRDFPWSEMYMPEDLVFLRKNKSWFVTIMIEHEIEIYGDTEMDIRFFQQLGIKARFREGSYEGYHVDYDLEKTKE